MQQPAAGEPMETAAAPAEASALPMETSEASPALQADPLGAYEPGIGPILQLKYSGCPDLPLQGVPLAVT